MTFECFENKWFYTKYKGKYLSAGKTFDLWIYNLLKVTFTWM